MKIVAASKSTNSRRSRYASSGVACALLVVVSLLSITVATFGQSPQAPAGQTQQGDRQQSQSSGQKQAASPDVAGAQLASFFRAIGGRDIQGEALPLERLLYGVYSPAERYRRLIAYWDLAGKNAYYNLCVTCSAYATECATKIENQGAASQETQQLLTSVRQIALERQSEARLKLLQAQYDFDAAFTTPAGRRAATARAAQSGARSLDAARGTVFYLPSGKPATDFFETRFNATAQYRNVSAEAARLNTLLPLLYETLQARANQANRELDVLVALVKSTQVSESVLFASLDRYLEAQAQTIDAAVRYNQAIAAYATQTIPGSIQGAAFLATINQRPSAQNQQPQQQPQQQQQQQQAPQPGGAAPAQNGTPASGGAPPQAGATPGYSYIWPGLLPDGLKDSVAVSTPPQTPEQTSAQTTDAKPSDAAEFQVASLASIQALAPIALPKSDAPAALPSSSTAEPVFTLVGSSRPVVENAPAALNPATGNASLTNVQPATSTNEPAPAQSAPDAAQPQQQAPAPAQPAPDAAQPQQEAPAPAQPAPDAAQPQQQAPAPAQPTPESEQPKPGDVVASADAERPVPRPSELQQSAEADQEFPIVVVITGYEQPLKPSEATIPVELEQATASEKTESPSNPDGAFLWPQYENAVVSLFARIRASFMTSAEDSTARNILDSSEYVVRGQDFSDFSTDDAAATPDNATASNDANSQVRSGANAADAERVRELVNALFAIEPPNPRDRESNVHERLYTLHEIANRSDQSPASRYAVAAAFWKLQGACARLRVEETIFRNFSLVYNNLITQSGEDSDAARSCLAAALGQQARVTEAKSVKRAAQIELVKLMGLSPANAALPLPASIPFCGVKFDLGAPAYYNAQTRRSAGVIKDRVDAVQSLGAALGAPGQLLNIDTNAVSNANVDVCVAALSKKRESALLFIDHVVRLNFSIAEYVSYYPAHASSDQFVDALVGR